MGPDKEKIKNRILYTGPPGSGKTRALVDHYNRLRSEGREHNTLFIVPEATSREHIRDIISRNVPEGVPGAFSDRGIHSLQSLTRLLAGSASASVTHLEALIPMWLSNGDAGRMGASERVLETTGGIQLLARAIYQLRSIGHTADSVGRVSEKIFPLPLLISIMELWERWLAKSGLTDTGGCLRLAADRAKGYRWDAVLIDGFTEFNPLQWNLIESIIDGAGFVAAATDPDQVPSNRLTEEFLGLSFTEEKLVCGGRWSGCTNGHGFEWLARVKSWNILTPLPDTPDGGESVPNLKINRAGNRRLEAEYAMRFAAGCVHDGMSYSDIAIISPDIEKYRPYLRDAFRRAGIPIRFFVDVPLAETTAGSFIKSVLRLVTDGWSDENVRTVISHRASGIPREEAGKYVRRTLAVERIGTAESWLGVADGRVVEFLNKLADLSADKPVDPMDFISVPVGLATSGIRDAWRDDPDLAVPETAWGIQSVTRAVTRAASALKESRGNLPPKEIARFLQEQMSRASGRPLDRRSNCVNAVSLLASRTWGVRAAIVIGLDRNTFPHRYMANPFLPDALRIELGLPSYDELREREEALFRTAVTRASEKLALTWPESENDGTPLLASSPMMKIVEWYGEPEKYKSTVPDDINETVVVEDINALWLSKGIGVNKLPGKSGIADMTVVETGQYESIVLGSTGLLIDTTTGTHENPVTPTALNDLVQCPYKFFASRVLHLREPDFDLVECGLDARQFGIITHDVLASWFESGKAADFGQLVRVAVESNSAISESSVTDGQIKKIVDTLERFSRWEKENITDTGFKQAHAELEIGLRKSDYDPVEITLDNGMTLHLGGRIDRIDVSDDGIAIVIDYKSSKPSKFRPKDLRDYQLYSYIQLVNNRLDVNVQLACYVGLRKILIEGTGTAISEQPIRELFKGKKVGTRNDIGLKEHVEAATSEIGRLIDARGSGNVTPSPDDEGFCGKMCPFSDLCRYKFTGDEGGDSGGDG